MQKKYGGLGMCGAACVVALGAWSCGATDDVSDTSDPSAAGSSSSTSSSGSGGASGAAGGGATTVVTTGSGPVTQLSFDVTTASQGGKYSPKNIGAIWIADGSGAYVRSLEVWAGIRKRDLQKYVAALGSSSDADVVTSATLSQHRTHHVTWDLTDKSGATVPAGQYNLLIDVTDHEGDGQSLTIPFDTSAGTQTITPGTSTYYKTMSLLLE